MESQGYRFEWDPLVDSDDEDRVDQPSFVLKSCMAINAEGDVIADLNRPVTDKYDDTGIHREDWRKLFGKEFEGSVAIRNWDLEDLDLEPNSALLHQALATFFKKAFPPTVPVIPRAGEFQDKKIIISASPWKS